MAGIGRLIKISTMAIYAEGRSTYISIGVTAAALHGGMCPGKWEVRCIMIKVGGYPCGLHMASSTVCGISSSQMVGISGVVVIINVASSTGIGCIGIITIMATGAVIGNGRMRPIDHIEVIVHIKGGGTPSRLGGMTRGTII